MFSLRLKELRETKGLSQAELAKALNISQSTVGMWENGVNTPKQKTTIKLASFFEVSTDYLLTGAESKGFTSNKSKTLEHIFKKLPLYNIPVSAGTGQWLEEGYEYELEEFDEIPEDTDFALKVRGDSMEPLYFNDEIVFIKSNIIVESGQVGVFYLNGEGYLKMLQGNKLVSSNPKYPPIVIGDYDSFFCAGRVIGKAKV